MIIDLVILIAIFIISLMVLVGGIIGVIFIFIYLVTYLDRPDFGGDEGNF